jgi:uncharacterized protein (UPF0548 family)
LFKDIYPAGASAAFLFVPKYKLSRKAKQQAGWRVMNRILPVGYGRTRRIFQLPWRTLCGWNFNKHYGWKEGIYKRKAGRFLPAFF